MREQIGLDLAELDALAAELHLEVGAADVFQRAVLHPAHQVAGAVHAFAGAGERIRDEAVRGQVRAALVAARQLPSAQVQLAERADGGRAQARIQNVDFDIPLGHADRHVGGVGGGVLPVGHRDRGLGGAVQVVQSRTGNGAEACAGLGRQRLTDHENVLQRGALRSGSMRHEDRQHGRHEVGDGDAVAVDHVRHVERIAMPVRGGHDQLGAHHERQEVTPQRDVEGLRRFLQVHIVGGELVLVQHPQLLVDDGVVGDRDALGAAGGTRGVDDVGGVVRAQRGDAVGIGERFGGVLRHVEGVDLQAPHGLREFQLVARGGEHADRGRGFQDVGGAIGRVIRVDGHVRATGAQHRVHADHQLEGPPHTQGHKRFRAHAIGDEVPRQAVHPGAELGVGELLALELQGDIVRRQRDLRVQQFRQRGGRHLVARLVPLQQGAGALGRGGDGQPPHGLTLPRRQEAVEELQEPGVVLPGLVLGVQVRVGLEIDVIPGALDRLVEVDAQVLDGTGRQDAVLTGYVAEHDLVVEQHDVDPRAEELPGHHALAGGIAANVLVAVALVAQCAGHLDRHLLEQLGDRGLGADVQAQRHDIRHRTAGAPHDGGGARGHRQAENDVRGAGPLRQVGGETGDEQRRGRRIMAGHSLVQQAGLILTEGGGGHPVDRGGRGGAAREAGAVLETGDALGPVLLVGGESGAVAVREFLLDQRLQIGQLVRRGFLAAHGGGVQLGDALHIGDRAETVQHDVVDARVPVVMAVTQPQHAGLDETVRGEVQRRGVVRAHPLVRRGDRIGGLAEIDVVDGAVQRGIDHLHGLAVAFHNAQEAGAELLRPPHHGLFEQRNVQLTAQLHELGDIDRHLRVDVLGVPDAELRRRQREKRARIRCDFAASFAVAAEIQPVQH
ncbi:hypothetical protein Ntsu_70270 [Nocardia sp. IFM 10818]